MRHDTHDSTRVTDVSNCIQRTKPCDTGSPTEGNQSRVSQPQDENERNGVVIVVVVAVTIVVLMD